MQLDRLVSFHKALADPTRVRILALLARSPLHGQALAGKLGVKPPTITHHMSKLREAGLVKEKREKNTIYFHLEKTALQRKAVAILEYVERESPMKESSQEWEIVRHFFTPQGQLKHLPAQRKKRWMVLKYLMREFPPGETYTEQTINERLKKYHEDVATLRRELIIHHFMYREKGIYQPNPPELWSEMPG
ncbi:hypothetical protein GCM10011571_12140 [Marinithermofilum abyssi]|jgi:DNA-binding transcriptional ArsR family regulator|uniref:HTH arsR-type domain-containing protein n=1 Tax=Marinithermofilum abyssi TaxID=1571185 RepID=A0A8J2VEU3_9BACL|nr:metalloregulator ArsR/SmtB family transcription factor [Marinithermofilum abyssi]GGE12324.1 hypothetical protein GCM10011571_12140 [Marinithermofilum abyssi]